MWAKVYASRGLRSGFVLTIIQASNMNFGLHISCMVEEKLGLIQRPVDWTQIDEAQAYERCLKEALEENGRAWADGNIRVGDYILLGRSYQIYKRDISSF
jgi:hypothetical protein